MRAVTGVSSAVGRLVAGAGTAADAPGRRARVDGRDARVVSGNARSLEAGVQELGPGIYTVVWRALSIDGRVVRGAFAFSVGVDAPVRRAVLARTMRRFSTVAGTSMVALIVTGVYAVVVHVPSWEALLDTPYGAALAGKLLLVAPLLALGAVNLFVLHPRFVRAARDMAARATAGTPADPGTPGAP